VATPAADTPLLRVSHLYPSAKVVYYGGGSISLNQGEGEAFNFRVNPSHMKLSAKQTNGQFMLMEGTLLPGEGIIIKYIHTVLCLISRHTSTPSSIRGGSVLYSRRRNTIPYLQSNCDNVAGCVRVCSAKCRSRVAQ
jgi:hypothetical protein